MPIGSLDTIVLDCRCAAQARLWAEALSTRRGWNALRALGATVVERHPQFTVMADPETNERCVGTEGL
jgi:hypothetical protein